MPSQPMRFFAAAFASLLSAGVVNAAALPINNAGFEGWDGLRLKDWGGTQLVGGAMDCEVQHQGKCSLRLSARQYGGKPFAQLNQVLPAAAFAGDMVRLSGWIKVAGHTSGQASLWMQVRGLSGTGQAFDNMAARSPHGDTGWQPFDIALPVTSQAATIAFGVLFSGAGKAWFDDLRIEAAGAGSAASTALPPSRPCTPGLVQIAPQGLGIGAVRTTPIASLTSSSFDDLQFLKPLLKERRIVALGESAHGVAEFSKVKTRLIKFLHEQMGYDVIAFETPMQGCEQANSKVGKEAAASTMRTCLFPVWHTSDNVELFEYIAREKAAGRALHMVGFDIQSRGLSDGFTNELTRLGGPRGADLASRITEAEQQMAGMWKQTATDQASALLVAYRSAAAAIGARQLEPALAPADALRLGYLALQMDGRVAELTKRTPGLTQQARTETRDAAMAKNLEYLAAHDLQDQKIIVWAHNFHMAKAEAKYGSGRQMGSRLAQTFGKSYYAMGLLIGRGEAG